jgi:hypothetical protein
MFNQQERMGEIENDGQWLMSKKCGATKKQ